MRCSEKRRVPEAAIRVTGEAAEVARAEAQAVLSMVQDEERRARLADIVAAVDEGEIGGRDADGLAELLELGLGTGRVRSVYGPEGEQAALALFRRLPLGRELTQSTRDLIEALGALEGRSIDRVAVNAVGPGEYGVTISTDDYEIVMVDDGSLKVGLDRSTTEQDVVSSAAETSVYSYSVPVGTIGTNKILRLTVTGSYLNNSGSPDTFTPRVKFGGTTIATGSWEFGVKMGDAATGRARATFRWPIGRVYCLAYAPDGLRLAAGDDTGTVVVWDME